MNLPEYFAMVLDEREAKYAVSIAGYDGFEHLRFQRDEDLQRLREIEALRGVLKIHNTYVAAGSSYVAGCYCVGCGSVEYNSFPRIWDVNECPTLLALVEPYSDRPDFGNWS